MPPHSARIISFVPSLTETLIEMKYQVVGRTRYCLHPADQVANVSVVGGTKDFNRQKILELRPDVVVLDQEENRKELYQFLIENQINVFVFHVTDLTSLLLDLKRLCIEYPQSFLENWLNQNQIWLNKSQKVDPELFFKNCLLRYESEDIQKIQELIQLNKAETFEYLIWKNPWMGIGGQTFISDVLSKVGIRLERLEKYPVLSEDELKNKFVFLSSEPFPFESHFNEFKMKWQNHTLGQVLIDGEKISWYGIRSIRFLNSVLGL